MRYNFDSKKQYRDALYSFIEKHLRLLGYDDDDDGLYVYLESPGAHETTHLLSRGLNPSRLVPVTESPAKAATITRRIFQIHGVKVRSRGQDILHVLRSIRRGEKSCNDPLPLSINLDYTSSIHKKLGLHVFDCAPGEYGFGFVSVTVLRGRETKETWPYIQAVVGRKRLAVSNRIFRSLGFSGRDLLRLAYLRMLIQKGEEFPSPVMAGTYKSNAGSQTMLFLCVGVDNGYFLVHKQIKLRIERLYSKRLLTEARKYELLALEYERRLEATISSRSMDHSSK